MAQNETGEVGTHLGQVLYGGLLGVLLLKSITSLGGCDMLPAACTVGENSRATARGSRWLVLLGQERLQEPSSGSLAH